MRWLVVVVIVAASCKSNEGESCDVDDGCKGKLVCRAGRCAVGEAIYRDMADQSGVPLARERPVGVAGPGAVRVRSARGAGVAIAICAADERLIGGWCDPAGHGTDNTDFTSQGIVGNTETDTLGAQWKCSLRNETVRAFALCQLATAP